MKPLVLALMMGCCLLAAAQAQNFGKTDGAAPVTEQSETVDEAPVAEKIASLNLRERVSQLMFVTLSGLYGPNVEDRALLTSFTPGGVVISRGVDPGHIADYVKAVRSLPAEREIGIALFIGTNLYDLAHREGGSPGAVFQLPSLLSIAAAADEHSTARLGKLMAEYLTTLGFNMSLGPSLELAPNLPGARGTVHCFGNDPQFAAAAGCAIINALSESNIVAMPMGFPGGGRNRLANTPAALLTPGPLLAQQDLLPFARAIERGVSVLHVANTLVPTIDPGNQPASLSSVVMRDLLRDKLGFEGVIVAGPMDAPDLRRLYEPARAALLALEAGADMLYWNSAGDHVMKSVVTIAHAVRAGELSESTIDEALARILRLKTDRQLSTRPLPSAKNAEKLRTKRQYKKQTYEIERRSVTLVQNRGNALPLAGKASLPAGVTGVVGVEELTKAMRKHTKAVIQQPIMTAKYAGEIVSFEVDRIVPYVGDLRTVVCVFTDTQKTAGQRELIHGLKGKGVNVVVVLLGYPNNLPQLIEADAIVLAYCDDAAVSETMKAVSDVLLGRAAISVPAGLQDLETQVGKAEKFRVFDLIRAPAGRLPVTLTPPFEAGFAIPYNPSLAVKKVQWDFGDGKRAKGLDVEHLYKEPGRRPVTVAIGDQQEETTEVRFNISVSE